MKKKYITFYIIVSIFVLFIGLTLCQFEQFNNPILLPSQNQNIENEGAEAASNSFSVTLTSYIRNRYGSTITGMNIELYVSSGYKGDYNWKYHVYYPNGSYGKRTGSLTRILGQQYRGLCIETSCDYTGRKTSWVGYKATDSSNSNVYAELLTSSAVSIRADTRSYFEGMTISSICSSGFKNDVDYNDNYASPNFYINLYPNILYSFDMNGGSSSNGANTSIIYNTRDQRMQSSNGNTMSKLTVPNRTGYTFAGYYTAKSGGTQVIDADGKWTGNWNRDNIRIAPLYAQWTPNQYDVNINIYSPEGNEEYTSNVNGTYTLKDENGSVFTGQYNEISGKKITFNTSWQIYNIVPGPGMSLDRVTSSGFSQSQSGNTYTFTCTGTSGLTINIYMKWNEYKIDINFYQPNGSTQEGGTFDLYKQLSGGSKTLIQKGLSNELSGSEYLQYEGKFILEKITPLTGTTISSVSLKNSNGTLSTSGNPINTITYTASQTGPASGGWDNAILIHTSTNNVLANLDCQGGIVESSPPSQQYNEDGTYLSLPTPTREGYKFLGWNTKDDGSGKYYKSSTNFNDLSQVEAGHCEATANAGNIEFTLYAIWEANDYDVTLNDGSGAVSNLADMPWIGNAAVSDGTYSYTSGNLKIDYNAKTKDLKLNGTPTNGFILFLNKGLSFKEGGQFKIEITHKSGSMLSWAGNGYFVFEVCDQNGNNFSTNRQYLDLLSINSLAIGSTYSDTLTINANSAKLGKGLKVWYYAAGTPASQMITNYEVNFKITKLGDSQNANKKVVATYDSPMNVVAVPSKFGHTFNGYFDKVSDGTKYYKADGTSDRNWDKANTATLHAQWTPYSYTLTLEGNGGTTANGQAGITTSGSYTSNLKLQSKPFTRAGYIFKGWSTTKNGAVIYLDGANYSSLITNNNISITLYAQWEETIASDITSTYSTAGTYYINTAADLAKLIYTTEDQDVGNGYIFIQTANIDLSDLTYLPIGRLNSFSGTYDGQGYTISGLKINNNISNKNNEYLEENGGLFANASGATIKNVIIEDATIYGQNAGIIAGSASTNNTGSSTNISNCVVSGSVKGIKTGSIIGNGDGVNISTCLAKGVNTASFAGGSANVDSCIYELNDASKTRGKSNRFNNYSDWIYPSNFAYPMPKAFIWYPYPELSEDSLNTWLGK